MSFTISVFWRCSPKTAICAKDSFESFGFFLLAQTSSSSSYSSFSLLFGMNQAVAKWHQNRNGTNTRSTRSKRYVYMCMPACMYANIHMCVAYIFIYTFICGLVVQTDKLKTQLIVDRDVCERLCVFIYIFCFFSLLLLLLLLSSIHIVGWCVWVRVYEAAWHSFRQIHRFPLDFVPIS